MKVYIENFYNFDGNNAIYTKTSNMFYIYIYFFESTCLIFFNLTKMSWWVQIKSVLYYKNKIKVNKDVIYIYIIVEKIAKHSSDGFTCGIVIVSWVVYVWMHRERE